MSKRCFDGKVQAWRRSIHKWDGELPGSGSENGSGSSGGSDKNKNMVTVMNNIMKPPTITTHIPSGTNAPAVAAISDSIEGTIESQSQSVLVPVVSVSLSLPVPVPVPVPIESSIDPIVDYDEDDEDDVL